MPTRVPYFVSKFKPVSSDVIRGNSNQRGYDAAWRRTRDAYLQQNPLCQIAGPTCTTLATLVDHRRPLNDGGGRLDWNNLRSGCKNCHAVVTSSFKATGINELPKGTR